MATPPTREAHHKDKPAIVTAVTARAVENPYLIRKGLRRPVRPMIWIARLMARSLGTASRYFRGSMPEHLHTARSGEMEAYFYLRSLGYRIVAKNYRSARDHGEIDIIGWDEGVLCFIEVKTQSRIGMVPPEIAVDAAKKSHIRSVARRYVRQFRADRPPTCRFDVVSVVLGDESKGPVIRLHKGAFEWRSAPSSARNNQVRQDRKRWWK